VIAAERALAACAAAGVILSGCARKEPTPDEAAPPPATHTTDDPRFQRALDELRAGRLWPGMWHLTAVLHEQPSHHGALSGLGIYAYQQGRYEDARTYLEPLAVVRPLLHDEMLALADASLKLNRFTAAESLFVAAGRRRPTETGVLVALGAARRSQGKLDEAAADFRHAIELDPRLDDARFALAEILLDTNRAEEAWIALTPVPDSTAEPARLRLLRARVLEQQARKQDPGAAAAGTTRQVIAELEACLEHDPDNVDALHLLMQARRRIGDLDGARAAANRHREALAARDRAATQHAMRALVQGGIAIEQGDEEAALAAWEKGLVDDPGNANLHCVLAPLYQKLGRKDDARASFGVLRQAMQGAVPGPLFLATGQELRRRGLPKAAVGQFEVALDRMPDSEEARYFLALALAESGDWDAAVAAAAPFEAAPPAAAP
jgi:tetratricopeptide (TPR) repeat protein